MARPISDINPVEVLADDSSVGSEFTTTTGVDVLGYDWIEFWLSFAELSTDPAAPETLTVSWETSADGNTWAPVMTEALTDGVYVQTPYQVSFALTGETAPVHRMARVPVHGRAMRMIMSVDAGSAGGTGSTFGALRRVGG